VKFGKQYKKMDRLQFVEAKRGARAVTGGSGSATHSWDLGPVVKAAAAPPLLPQCQPNLLTDFYNVLMLSQIDVPLPGAGVFVVGRPFMSTPGLPSVIFLPLRAIFSCWKFLIFSFFS
jgi:hypothetical protein